MRSVASASARFTLEGALLYQHPRKVFVASAGLAFVAGQVNAVGFAGVFHEALSHMTGAVTRGGLAFANGDFALAASAALLVASFAVGALISGAIVGWRSPWPTVDTPSSSVEVWLPPNMRSSKPT